MRDITAQNCPRPAIFTKFCGNISISRSLILIFESQVRYMKGRSTGTEINMRTETTNYVSRKNHFYLGNQMNNYLDLFVFISYLVLWYIILSTPPKIVLKVNMWDSKQQLPKQFTAWMVSSDIVLSTEWYSASIYEARTAAHKHYPQIKLMRLPRSTPFKKNTLTQWNLWDWF